MIYIYETEFEFKKAVNSNSVVWDYQALDLSYVYIPNKETCSKIELYVYITKL